MKSFLKKVTSLLSLSFLLGSVQLYAQMEPPTGDGHFIMDCGSIDYTVSATPGAGGTDVRWYSDYLCTSLLGTGTSYSSTTTESIVIYAATTDGTDISADPKQVYIFKPEFPSGSIDVIDDALCSGVDLILNIDVYTDSLEIFASEDATIDPTAAGTNFNNELLNIRADGFCGGDVKFLQKWDLTTIPVSVLPVFSSMTATAYAGFAHGGDGSVKTKLVDDDTWEETTVTHGTAPAASADNYGQWWIWYGWPSYGTAHAGSADLVSIGASPEGNKTSTNNNILLNDIVSAEFLADQILSTYHWSPGYDTKYYSKDYKTDENLLIKLKNVFDYNDAASSTYSWTGPGGYASTDKDLLGLTATGTYTVTITSAYGCETTISQFVDVPIGDPIVIDAVILNTCIGVIDGEIDATVTGGTPAYSFLWDSGEVTEDITGLGAGSYTLTVTDDNGCTGTNTFIVDEFPNPIVDLGPDDTYCSTETITLDAANPGSTYLWQDGSTDQTFLTNIPGTYEVIVTNANGCTSSDEITLLFEDPPNAGDDNATEICKSDGLLDLNTLLSAGTTPGGVWAESTIPVSGAFDEITGVFAIHSVPAGTYGFGYTVESMACPDDVANFVVDVFAVPDPGEDNSAELCTIDGPLNLNTLLSAGVSAGTWSETTIPASGSFDLMTGFFNPDGLSSGDYTFEYLAMASGPCPAVSSYFTISVTENPVANFTVNENVGCLPFTTEFTNTSIVGTGGSEYFWEFGDGGTSDLYGPVGHTFESEGCFDVSLTVTTNGCSSSQTFAELICTYAMPIANFDYGPHPIYADNPNVSYVNFSEYATTYSWVFGDGSSSELENPSHSFPDQIPGSYLTVLYAYNDYGCVDSTFKLIEIKDIQIFYVPNVFTPDGSGFNDKFNVQFTSGLDIYDYHMTIYNRWGEPVWETYNVAAGWDGTYAGQGIIEDGVYIWKMEFGDNYSDERFEHIGHVTVLK